MPELPSTENSSAVIDQVLRDRRWFGDGPPHWTVGRDQRPAETAQDARHQAHAIIAFLKKHGSENRQARALARTLNRCRQRDRCASPACPKCARAYRRWFVWSGAKILNKLGDEINVLSIVPADHRVPVGE